MDPIAMVIALLGVMFIAGRGPLLVAPTATVDCYRRMLSTRERVRLFGGAMVLLAVLLIASARMSRAADGGLIEFIEGFGWFVAVLAVWLIIAPGSLKRLVYWFWDAVSNLALRRGSGPGAR